MSIVEVFKLLSDTSRLRIINLLYYQKSMCVCELEFILELSQPNLSKHLINMKKLNVVSDNKKAKFTFYSLNQTFLQSFPILKKLIENEVSQYDLCNLDLIKLEKYNESDLNCDLVSAMITSKSKGEK